MYRREYWVRDTSIISKKKKCNVVGRKVWFADKGAYWTMSSGIVLIFFVCLFSAILYFLSLQSTSTHALYLLVLFHSSSKANLVQAKPQL